MFDAPALETTNTRAGELPIPEPEPGAVRIRVTHAGEVTGRALTPVANRTHDPEENRHVQDIARADAL